MEFESIFKYGQYLSHLISCTINSTEPDAPFEGMDWARLFRLACFHKAESLIFPTVKKLPLPADILNKFTYNNHRMIAREARQEIEAQKIFSLLKEKNIPFIKMKGIVMKHFYPMPYMRSQTDIDLCMSKEDRLLCAPIMKELGYKVFSSNENTDEYEKDDFFYYEMHSSLSTSFAFSKLYDNPFSNVKPADDNIGYVFTDEYFYLHIITHLYKHFIVEGCGIRFLCDMYIFKNTHPNMDIDYVRSLLAEYGMADFYDSIIKLIACLFDGKPFSTEQAEIATFIFKCGDHGNNNIRNLAMSVSRKSHLSFWSKIRFTLQIYFPPAKELKLKYPTLEKAPVLLPFFWIKRGFSTLFFKREAIAEQNKRIKSVHSVEIKEAQRVRALLKVRENMH